MSKITETMKLDAEVLAITSGAGSTSRNYDMQGYSDAAIIVAVDGTYQDVTLDLMESSGATVAGSSAAGGKTGITLGGANTAIVGARSILLTMGTGATGATGDAITIMGKRFVFSTSTANHNATAWNSTRMFFGSTVGSTVNTGAQLSIDGLRTALVSTLGFGNAVICSTPATNTLRIDVADAATGAITFGATGDTAMITAQTLQACGVFNLKADEMTSTANKRYLSVKVSTAATSCKAAVTVIRSGGRYLPPADGKYVLSS